MRKLFYITVILCLSGKPSSAQLNIFDDINLGSTSGNLQLLPNPGEWGTTHGTPSYNGTDHTLWMWSAYQIYQEGAGIKSEGVSRRVNFVPGSKYNVTIGIPQFNAKTFTNAKFSVLLCNDPIPPNCSSTGCPIPTFASSRFLYTYEGGSFTDQNLHLTFSTNSGESYKYIVIYPGPNSSSTSIELTISCLSVVSCASLDVTYCNTIPGGTSYWNNIYIGSSFCSSSTPATATPNATTDIIGVGSIVIGSDADIAASAGSDITMEISPCTPFGPSVQPGQVIASYTQGACSIAKPALLTTAQKQITEIQIYPNPTNDVLNVVLPSDGKEVTITVHSMDGKILKTIHTNAAQVTFSLKENPDGVYLIRVSSASGTIVKKVVKANS